jgi:hypothetical protein
MESTPSEESLIIVEMKPKDLKYYNIWQLKIDDGAVTEFENPVLREILQE